MWSVIALVVFLIVGIAFAAFFWFWQTAPIDQVPPHLDEKQLRRLEVQDRLRQTNYQVLTALALGATFLTTLFQFAISTQHWSAEFDSRLRQERLTQFVEAVKQISQVDGAGGKSPSARSTANLAGIRVLAGLGTQQPDEYHAQAEAILSTYVKEKTASEIIQTVGECANNPPPDREEADVAVQAAMTAMGDPKFASFRRTGGFCGSDPQKPPLRLEHLFLDDLDLSNLDLSCSRMTNSHFRRVSFYNTDLSYADLRGLRIADFNVPKSPAAVGDQTYQLYNAIEAPPPEAPTYGRLSGPWLAHMFRTPTPSTGVAKASTEKTGDPSNAPQISQTQTQKNVPVEEWKRYRCWITDLRHANLANANLEGADLGGADLRNANVTDANFCRADVSRANFQGAVGLRPATLKEACAGQPGDKPDDAAQPIGLPTGFEKLPRCSHKKCSYELTAEDKAVIEPAGSAPPSSAASVPAIQIGHNLVLACFLVIAWSTFWLVGTYAARRLEVRLGPETVEFASRFPERGPYSTAQLNAFVRQHSARSRFYVWPVLFPLDVVVMLMLAGAMGAASYYWIAQSLPFGLNSWAWIALIFPAAYFVADLVEDLILAVNLTVADLTSGLITDARVKILKAFTRLKFIFIWCTIIETITALLFYLFMTACNWPYLHTACVDRSYPDVRIILGLPTDLSFLDRSIAPDTSH